MIDFTNNRTDAIKLRPKGNDNSTDIRYIAFENTRFISKSFSNFFKFKS